MPDTIRITKTDHDILTEQGRDIKYIGLMLKESKDYQKEMFDKINNKIDNQHVVCSSTVKLCNEKYTTSKIFWKIVAILFTLLVGSYGYTSTLLYVIKG